MTFPVESDVSRIPGARKAETTRQAPEDKASGARFAEHMTMARQDEAAEAETAVPAAGKRRDDAPPETPRAQVRAADLVHVEPAELNAQAETADAETRTETEARPEADAKPEADAVQAIAAVTVDTPAPPRAETKAEPSPETRAVAAPQSDSQGADAAVEAAPRAAQQAQPDPAVPDPAVTETAATTERAVAAAVPANPASPAQHAAAATMATTSTRASTAPPTGEARTAVRLDTGSRTGGDTPALRAEAAHAAPDADTADAILPASGKDNAAGFADLLSGKGGQHDRIAVPDSQSLVAAMQATGEARAAQPLQPAVPTPQLTPVREQAVVAAPADVGDVVARHLSSDGPGKERIVVQLDPPELGRVSIDFKFEGTTLQQVTVTSDNPEALRQMRQMQADLAAILQRHGMSSENMSFRQGGQGSGDRSPGNPSGRNPGGRTLSTAAEPLIAASAPRLSPGRLNITL